MTADGENLTPGEMLAAARGKTDLSLEQMAENTKIPLNMLRAIEMDEYHKISGDLYVKSFLRSYATEVGLEPEEMIELYHIFTGATADSQQAGAEGAWNESDVQIKHVGLPWGLIIIIVVLLVVAGGAYYWFSMKNPSEPGIDPSVVKPAEYEVQPGNQTLANAVIDSIEGGGALPDTLALGWHTSEPRETDIESVVNGSNHLPESFAGTPQVVFHDGRKWPYVVRLISASPGQFEVMRDAETKFQSADFPANRAEAKPLSAETVVAGRAYAVKRGFVVYWGVNDHMSIRLGHTNGVELSFNGRVQDLDRFNAGQEILLDPSILTDGAGN